ncbi:MAG: hypothetical protein ABSH48_14390 [Verrucomicrobiota bacterium]
MQTTPHQAIRFEARLKDAFGAFLPGLGGGDGAVDLEPATHASPEKLFEKQQGMAVPGEI